MPLNSSRYGLIPIGQVDQRLIGEFTCGRASLDSFLKSDARDFHDGRIGHTYCVFHEDIADSMVGFFTMSNDVVKMNTSEIMELGVNAEIKIDAIPAVLIGRFAIKAELQSHGYGQDVMELAIDLVLDSSPAPARLAVVDAVNESRIIRFYEKCGFKRSLFAENQARQQRQRVTVKMFKDVLAK